MKRVAIALFFLALGVAALRDVARIGEDLPWHAMTDFRDFYCAGDTLNRHANPYTYEPLRTCEHSVNPASESRDNTAVVVPAPQPPYDFPFFMALARLGFAHARVVYGLCLVITLVLAVLVLWRLRIPLDVAFLALALIAGYQELQAGQIVPFVLLALVASGWMLFEGRDLLAGIFAGLTAFEPHLGAGVVLSVLLFAPRARWSLIATCVVLALAGVLVAGPSVFLTYLTGVLPAQAAAEVRFPPQYSLTYALFYFGMSDASALLLGAASFVVLLVAGLVLAPRVAARLERRDLLAFFPAATAVMGGAYVHVVELCFAVPAALVLACYARGLWRSIAALALAFLAVPWILAWELKKLLLASLFVMSAMLYRLRAQRWLGIAAVALAAFVLYVVERHPPWLPTLPPMPRISPGALAETEWQSVVHALYFDDYEWFVIKVPAWCALGAILATGIANGWSRAKKAT